jgi:hypothetical protein
LCIAFTHRKSRKKIALLIKPVKVIELLLVSMGIELVIGTSVINFDMTFAKFSFWGEAIPQPIGITN